KFINGNAWGQDETVPTACGFGSPANRLVVVPQTDTILPAVCFGSCSPCPAPPPPVTFVTFNVSTKGKIVSTEGVHLAGTFNQWNYAQYKLNQVQPNIYQITIPLDTGAEVFYKYSINSSFTGQEIISGSCTQFGNRFLKVPATDTLLPVVCFELCDTSCFSIGIDDFDRDQLKAFFHRDQLIIHGLPSGAYPFTLTLFDLTGRKILDLKDVTQPEWVRTIQLPAASYLLRLSFDNREKTFRLVKLN
ncbi:MAG: T9SS type A sorting domain-containing protein, partial [Thermaurantimonas sp.]